MALKSAISFGLVYIPVKLHLAVRDNAVSFNMIEKKTMSRVKYLKTCVDCNNREIKNEDIVKGYEYEDGKYVLFDDSDYEKIKTKKDKNIVIESFISIGDVDPIYYDKSYYVQPAGADKAYSLLVAAMEQQGRAGTATTVLGKKENIVVLRPYNGVLLLSTLHFKEEIAALPFSLPDAKPGKGEMQMAVSLINSMEAQFSPEDYTDEYTERLKAAIQSKVEGKQLKSVKETKEPYVADLMKALELSLSGREEKKKGFKKPPAPKKTAAPKRKAAAKKSS